MSPLYPAVVLDCSIASPTPRSNMLRSICLYMLAHADRVCAVLHMLQSAWVTSARRPTIAVVLRFPGARAGRPSASQAAGAPPRSSRAPPHPCCGFWASTDPMLALGQRCLLSTPRIIISVACAAFPRMPSLHTPPLSSVSERAIIYRIARTYTRPRPV